MMLFSHCLTRIAGVLAAVAVLAGNALATTITLRPIADTSLYGDDPDNNLGAELTLPAGATSPLPETELPRTNRALIKFNVVGALPPSAIIQTASLSVTVMQLPSVQRSNSVFELRRVLLDWGEGNKKSSSPSKNGAPATAGEATWNARFFPSNLWATPGGAFSVDFANVISATVPVSGLGAYTFATTPALVADIREWLTNSSANFGWVLRSQSESIPYTNRRFGSREDTNNAPVLTIIFEANDLRIDLVERSGDRLDIHFTAQPQQTYTVKYRNSVATGSWLTLTNVPAQATVTNVIVCDSTSASPQRYYRIEAP